MVKQHNALTSTNIVREFFMGIIQDVSPLRGIGLILTRREKHMAHKQTWPWHASRNLPHGFLPPSP
jgi:hypothetical protein